MSPLVALFIRDVGLAVRVGGGGGIGVLFLLIVTALMPFAIGPDLALLGRIGPAILWLGALLASLLTLDRLFAVDLQRCPRGSRSLRGQYRSRLGTPQAPETGDEHNWNHLSWHSYKIRISVKPLSGFPVLGY